MFTSLLFIAFIEDEPSLIGKAFEPADSFHPASISQPVHAAFPPADSPQPTGDEAASDDVQVIAVLDFDEDDDPEEEMLNDNGNK